MATIAVSAAGAAGLFTGIGQAGVFAINLAALGVDAYLANRSVRKESNEGPRIGDLQVSGSQEGTPVVRMYGSQVRIPGFVAWASPVREVRNEQTGGGKGGSGGTFITYQARRSAAIQFGNAELSGLLNGVSRFVKVIADGKVFWDGGDASSSITASSTSIVATVFTGGVYLGTSWNFLILEGTGEALKEFVAGQDVDVSGFTSPATGNNGTWRVMFVTATPAFPPNWKIQLFNPSNSSHSFQAKAAGDPVTVVQKNTVPLQTATPPDFYLGTQDQEAHRLLVEFEKDNVSGDAADLLGMRGCPIMWLDDLLLTDFGNRLPNFEAVLDVSPESVSSLAGAIKQLCLASGLPEEYIDTTAITQELGGYHSAGIRSPKSDVQPLVLAHTLSVRETGEQLVFEPRGSAPQISMDASEGDFAVSEYGGSAPDPFRVTDGEEKSVPTEINLRFANSENDHQAGNRRARYDHLPSASVQDVDLFGSGVAMTPDEAEQLTHQMLAQTHVARQQYRGTVSPRFHGQIHGGMILNASNAMGRSHQIYVRRTEEGANGVTTFEGQREDQEVQVQTWTAEATPLTGSSGTAPSESLKAAPGTVWHMMDIPALRDEHRNQPGFYIAAASGSPGRRALGFVLYESTDSGASYTRMAELGREAVMGFATTLPSSSGISEEAIDTTSTLRVELHDPAHKLSSVTEAEMLKGKNAFLWGDEIIGARTVTLVSTGVYDLSNLYRGARDTGDAITTHAVGDRIVQLDTQGIHFIPTNYYGIGTERHYKVVANGGIVADELGVAATLTGRNVQPFRPTLVQGARDGSDNLAITWSRAGRALVGSGHTQPLDESAELYRVSIYNGPTFVKTVDGLTDASYDYTAIDQGTDGFSVPSDVTVRVYQRSSVLGWGRYREAVLS